MEFAARVAHHPRPRGVSRLAASMWRQAAATPVCPATSLAGRIALVTGGSRGIGLETGRGLAERGARVVSCARSEPAGPHRTARFVPLDLADLRSVADALARIEALLAGRRLDVVVANAGLWPTRHRLSAQGHEIAFATNVLGHHALIRGMQRRGLLAEGARVVVVTGDIYVLADSCTPDFRYRGARGGQQAYCRSKLGNLWQVHELARRHPELCVVAVHPGVVASDLGGPAEGAVGVLKRALLLSPEQGAQTPLYAATAPDLPSGCYLHNTLGRIELHPDDPAADADAASALWDQLERLVADANGV
ncbi:MAG: SDR family NAD(P)-dependent oxidoreductase [Myxococcota bacterium]